MLTEPTLVDKLRGLPWSVATNALNSVFAQFTLFGSVFVLFLDSIGLTKTAIGFVLALVPLSSVLAPVVAPAIARRGYKRIFILFYALRKAVTALLLLTPWVHEATDGRATFSFVATVVGLFAVARTIEETAYIPWVQQFVPNSVRGKYSATSNIFTALTGAAAIWVAGLVLGLTQGLAGFMLLFALGVVFGLASVWCSSFIPGGAALPETSRSGRAMVDAFQDRDLRTYSLGVALLTLGTVPLAAFLPLFMQEEVGLQPSTVVLLQTGTLFGALVSSYLWGWAADRYGSKPVMLLGSLMLVITPVLWWLVPRQSGLSLAVALAVAFVQGIANLGWGIGAGRLFYVRLVPVEKSQDYMAVYFAWVGVVSGLSQFGGGRALDLTRDLLEGSGGTTASPYVLLFAAALFLPLAAVAVLHSLPGDSGVSTTQFAAILLRGNPVLAMGSMVRFYRAKDEHDAVLVTEQMGEIGSRLTVDELLEALADPRFNVRFEAILAMARMPPDTRVTRALIEVLEGRSPALSVVAAWALGRAGDSEALGPLRTTLNSQYRSVRAYSARALGTLGDTSQVPELAARLEREEDEDLAMAYASALGRLRARDSIHLLLARLRSSDDEANRMELALALARLAGNERGFIHLTREMRHDPGTAAAQALGAVGRNLRRRAAPDRRVWTELATIEERFARGQIDEGARSLGRWLEAASVSWASPVGVQILEEARCRLTEDAEPRREYLLLALHILATWRPE